MDLHVEAVMKHDTSCMNTNVYIHTTKYTSSEKFPHTSFHACHLTIIICHLLMDASLMEPHVSVILKLFPGTHAPLRDGHNEEREEANACLRLFVDLFRWTTHAL